MRSIALLSVHKIRKTIPVSNRNDTFNETLRINFRPNLPAARSSLESNLEKFIAGIVSEQNRRSISISTQCTVGIRRKMKRHIPLKEIFTRYAIIL